MPNFGTLFQGDTASAYLFILVLEILILRIILDDNVTKIKPTHPTQNKEDGGDLTLKRVVGGT